MILDCRLSDHGLWRHLPSRMKGVTIVGISGPWICRGKCGSAAFAETNAIAFTISGIVTPPEFPIHSPKTLQMFVSTRMNIAPKAKPDANGPQKNSSFLKKPFTQHLPAFGNRPETRPCRQC